MLGFLLILMSLCSLAQGVEHSIVIGRRTTPEVTFVTPDYPVPDLAPPATVAGADTPSPNEGVCPRIVIGSILLIFLFIVWAANHYATPVFDENYYK